ncbi:MAG: hypothetical protein R3D46_10145 [Defluviimonas denitrificans]
MRHGQTLGLLAAAGLFAACTAPDIGPEVAAFSKAADHATEAIGPALAQSAEAERQAAHAAAIRAGRSVHVMSSGCANFQSGVPGATLGACVLRPMTVPAEGRDEATRVAAVHAALQGYLSALTELAHAKTPSEIGASAALLLEGGRTCQGIPSPGLARVAGALGQQSTAIGALAQRAAEAARFAALRRAIVQADPAVAAAADTLIAYARKHRNAETDSAYDALLEADAAMHAAQARPDALAYGRAVARAERAWASYVRAARKSPVTTLSALRETHHALARRISAPADPEAIVDFLTQLKSLSDIVENVR